jgi:hypothetical protein
MLAAYLAGDARHRVRMAGAIERAAGIVDVDALERGGEAVRVALAPHLAVGNDVEAGALLVADGDERGVVLRLLEPLRRHPPQLARAHPRWKPSGELLAVDQPFRLRVGADQRGGKQRKRHGVSSLISRIASRAVIDGSR